VPVAASKSGGQTVLAPSHSSALSHVVAAARHTAPAFPAACVHVPLASQASTLQALPSSVHGDPMGAKPSAAHEALIPSQYSATSQTLAAPRHNVPARALASAGHAAAVPVHLSATSQAPAMARHVVVEGLYVTAGHVLLAPVQYTSPLSHGPLDA
jgi:hypothetical protein